VDRRTKYYSQASHLVKPHQSFCLYANTRIGHLRNNSRLLPKNWTFWGPWTWCFLLCFFIFSFLIPVLLMSPSILSYSYSYHLHFLSFSCATTHRSPSQLLFLPFLIHSFPHLHFLLLSSPNLWQHYLSLYILTTHWLAYGTNCTKLQLPEILHYNNRNTPKNTQGHKTQKTLYLFSYPPTTFMPPVSATFTNSPKSTASLITITHPPNPIACSYNHQGVLYIICK
jgi:hypothetical protein